MKKKAIVDLIDAYYEGNDRKFFQTTIEIMKEFKEAGDEEIFNKLNQVVMANVRVIPAKKYKYDQELCDERIKNLEDIGIYLVPQED
jgi:hypothetical protein